jgi:hypothetical protein
MKARDTPLIPEIAVSVRAKHFHDDLAVYLRYAFEDVIANRLTERRIDTGNREYSFLHFLEKLVFINRAAPLLPGLQVNEELCHVDEFWIGAIFGPPGF